MKNIINRRQCEIDRDMESLMFEISELNKDYHDNCDMNGCQACIGE